MQIMLLLLVIIVVGLILGQPVKSNKRKRPFNLDDFRVKFREDDDYTGRSSNG